MTNTEWGRPARESLYKNLASLVHDLGWYDSGIWVVEQNELVVGLAKILKEVDPSFNIPMFIDSAMRRDTLAASDMIVVVEEELDLECMEE